MKKRCASYTAPTGTIFPDEALHILKQQYSITLTNEGLKNIGRSLQFAQKTPYWRGLYVYKRKWIHRLGKLLTNRHPTWVWIQELRPYWVKNSTFQNGINHWLRKLKIKSKKFGGRKFISRRDYEKLKNHYRYSCEVGHE